VKKLLPLFALSCLLLLLAGCDAGGGGAATATPAPVASSPRGRIVTANQGADSLSVIDVATDTVIATVKTGSQPHHVVPSLDGKTLWVTLYKENRLQVFDATTLQEVASIDVGAPSDDLTFSPDGSRLYASLGTTDAVAVVDAATRQLVTKVGVGRTPHGVKVRPDGKELFVTNTAENTVSVITLDGDPKMAITFKVGADPFEVTFSPDGAFAYVSNFLGDSLAVINTATRALAGTIRAGKQPAMLAFVPGGPGSLLWVANTGTQEVWVIDPATKKPVQRIPVGQGAHGVVVSADGKVYVTNTNDATVSVIDSAAMTVRTTIGVGVNPNGLSFVPAGQ
jgi:YVTN family beta-propeller protein